jgi:hypothetical protein
MHYANRKCLTKSIYFYAFSIIPGGITISLCIIWTHIKLENLTLDKYPTGTAPDRTGYEKNINVKLSLYLTN